jgi:flagellar basal-body rod protein FlgF
VPEALSAILGQALASGQIRLEQISLNAANATTAGYRRGGVASVAFASVMHEQEGVAAASAQKSPVSLGAPLLSKFTDFSQAAIQPTGRAVDVAIEGSGMFLVTDGERSWLTRAGSLSVNEAGELVGPKGLALVGKQGLMRVESTSGLSIDAIGRVTRNGQVLGQIRTVEPTEGAALSTSDGVLFDLNEQSAVQDVPEEKRAIRAGFLEGSNANGLIDMLNVMETVRHFESLVKVAQGYDDVLGKAIQKLGEV